MTLESRIRDNPREIFPLLVVARCFVLELEFLFSETNYDLFIVIIVISLLLLLRLRVINSTRGRIASENILERELSIL